ncbi:hypothetical protein ACLMJK_005995 [Lecanora helva]
MATASVMSLMKDAVPGIQPVINEASGEVLDTDDFNPKKHLDFKFPSKIHTMADLNLPADTGVSSVAVSEPFHLFTEEAVKRMRAEIFRQEVWENCQYSSNLAQCQLRGFAAKYAPFVYDVWKDPSVLGIISNIAGVELVPEMDFEIAHINISVKSEEQKAEELEAFRDRSLTEADEGIAGCPWEDDKPIVDWHTDSYPFVCVTMLSDCTSMIGGETALRTGNGGVVKVRGPQMGCAVVLQGRYIEHQALRALGATERITMVTSFRPKSHTVKDDTVLTTVRPISNLSELYCQFSEYRLEILEERIRAQRKAMRENESRGKKFNTKMLKTFLCEQETFLAHMNRELVDDDLVTKGCIDDSHLFSGFAKNKRKRIA